MNEDALVSIIITFLNPHPGMLREAIASILAQTYALWELILVDDGSSAETREVALAIVAAAAGRIRYTQHPDGKNHGAAASRNLGIRQARGKYVAFLDADDIWLPGKLQQQVAALERHPRAALTFGRHLRWHSWTGRDEDRARDEESDLCPLADVPLDPPTTLHLYLHDRCIPGVCGMLVRRDVALQEGGFEESLKWSEDQTLPYRIGLHHPVIIQGDVQWWYRKHHNSTTAQFQRAGQRYALHLVFLDWVAAFLRENNVLSPSLWAALYRRRAWYARRALRRRIRQSTIGEVLDASRQVISAPFRRVRALTH